MRILALALRRVRAQPAGLPGLEPRERALLPSCATTKRCAEFVAGRAAARSALRRLVGDRALGAAILRDGSGATARPVAIGADGSTLALVSITHAEGLAAAAAASSPVGLDTVVLEATDASFRREAFRLEEIAAWERWLEPYADRTRAACVAFAAKEAVLKWLGVGLALPLHSVSATPCGPRRPARLDGRLRAWAFPLHLEAPNVDVRLDGWIAASPRRVIVAACGPDPGS